MFSIVQSDIIDYGATLADFFAREFGHADAPFDGPIRSIPVWSDLVDRNV